MQTNERKWLAVPARVRDLHTKYIAAAMDLTRGPKNHPYGWEMPTEIGPVLIKQSFDAFRAFGQGSKALQTLIGGPNPLTAMLLGSAIGGTLGYGAGWLGHLFAPSLVTRKAPPRWAVAGLLGGAAVPFLIHGLPALSRRGLKGLLEQAPMQGGPSYSEREALEQAQEENSNMANRDNAGTAAKPELKKESADSRFASMLAEFTEKTGLRLDPNDPLCKFAAAARSRLGDAGGVLEPGTIPVDDWGQVIMRDPILEAKEKALAAGPIYAAGAMRGRRFVTPRDVGHIAINAGLGAGYGALGRIAAKFLGLGEPIQKGLQYSGLLAGAIRGVTGMGY